MISDIKPPPLSGDGLSLSTQSHGTFAGSHLGIGPWYLSFLGGGDGPPLLPGDGSGGAAGGLGIMEGDLAQDLSLSLTICHPVD